MTRSKRSDQSGDVRERLWDLRRARPRFGQLARELFSLSSEDLDQGLQQQRTEGGRIGEILSRRGLLDRRQIQEVLRQQARWTVAAVQSVLPEMSFPAKVRLSLCLPVYNEEGVIEDTLDAACAILSEVVEDFEIVVANDGSRDRTAEILDHYCQAEPRVRVVNNRQNLGYGGAVTRALRAAEGDLVAFADSDGQMSFLDLPRFLCAIGDHDVVIGYRCPRADHWLRRFNSWAWKRLMEMTLRMPVRDLDCGFKLFRAETVRHLKLTSRGNAISAEIMAQCTRAGLRIAEIPVEHLPRVRGDATGNAPSVVLRAFREIPQLIEYRWSAPPSLCASANGHGWALPERPLSVCMLAACPFPANYGTPGSIRELAEAVAERGHEVHVVTYPMGEDIPVRGVQIHRIPQGSSPSSVTVGPTWRKPWYDLQMAWKTLEVIRRYQPAVLHAHGYEAMLAAWICRRRTGIPVVYSGHHTMADELHTYKFVRPRWLAAALGRFLDNRVPRLADRCIPHSMNMEAFFHQQGLADRMEPVANFGINLDEFDAADGAAARRRYNLGSAPVVLYAGLVDAFQRLDLLLDAMAVVARRIPAVKLFMVTTIPNPDLVQDFRAQAEKRGLAEHLVITDPQPLQAMPELLSAADVAVVPRPQVPGFPIKLLNYMAARRACVLFASAASGMTHREHAYLATPDSSEALAEGILDVLGDQQLRQRLEQSGYDFVRANHDRRLIARRLWEAYVRAILGDPKTTGLRPASPKPFEPLVTLSDQAEPYSSPALVHEER